MEKTKLTPKEDVLRELLAASAYALIKATPEEILKYLKNNPERCIEIVKAGIEDYYLDVEIEEIKDALAHKRMTPEEREEARKKLKYLRAAKRKSDQIARFFCERIDKIRLFFELPLEVKIVKIKWEDMYNAIEYDRDRAIAVMWDLEKELGWSCTI